MRDRDGGTRINKRLLGVEKIPSVSTSVGLLLLIPLLIYRSLSNRMASPVADKGDTVHDADLKATQKAENFLADAQAGNDSETKMGLIAALKLYPKASAWSIAISFAVVMEGGSESVQRRVESSSRTLP